MLSEAYRAQLREMHERGGPPWGNKGFTHAQDVLDFAAGGSILDYGSGKGTLRHKILKLQPDADVRNYDPGIPEDSALPAPADLVVSTDVLEHIEPEHLQAVLDHMFGLARSRLYLHIALFAAKKTLPDGRNAHLIQEPAAWWLKRLRRDGWHMGRWEAGSKTATIWIERRADP